jgi:beta-lactamase class D
LRTSSSFYHDAIRIVGPVVTSIGRTMITRRHALGLLAAVSVLPSRGFADVAPQRSEIRDVFKWDGVTRSIEAWNRDHTMRSAIAASAVPVYQEIARRIGAERMQKYVDLFEYGNRDIGGGIDQFWLTGNLRIDPVQQVDFVDRLRRGVLPVSKRSQDLVRDILPVTKFGDTIIRAKSGLLGAEIGKPSLGWMVGWVEKGDARTVFALNLDCREPRHIADRMTLAQACLSDIGAI